MGRVIEAIVDSDLRVGQYRILKDVEFIEQNAEKLFSLRSRYGSGKVLVQGSNQGSKISFTADDGQSAPGLCGCLRNYLQAQNYSVNYDKLTDGILYTEMNPENVVNFILDLGMFSGFVKECSNINESKKLLEDWKEEFVDKNSYRNSEEYKSLKKRWDESRAKHDEYWQKYKEADDYLNKNGKPKPREEWTEEDEFNSIIGRKPKIYPDEKKAEKAKSDREKYIDLSIKAEKESTALHDEIISLELKAREIEKKKYNFSKPKKSNKTEFEGFKTETGVPYADERLAQGKAYISEMDPKEYILRCAFQIFTKGTIESTLSACIDSNIKKYASRMKSGKKFDMPYLDFTRSQQEGRHRAIAAMLAGIKKIPVLIM